MPSPRGVSAASVLPCLFSMSSHAGTSSPSTAVHFPRSDSIGFHHFASTAAKHHGRMYTLSRRAFSSSESEVP
eukprot:3728467-Pyramimonas_sp.AAC.2